MKLEQEISFVAFRQDIPMAPRIQIILGGLKYTAMIYLGLFGAPGYCKVPVPRISRAPSDHINIRILPAMVSGIPSNQDVRSLV